MPDRPARTTPGPDERTLIREAMDRLIAGRPLHSDGKLTTKSLAAEARLDRSVLYQKHPDLREEFAARIASEGRTPAAFTKLESEALASRERIRDLVNRLDEAESTIRRYARIVQVLTIENAELRTAATAAGDRNVRPLRAVDDAAE